MSRPAAPRDFIRRSHSAARPPTLRRRVLTNTRAPSCSGTTRQLRCGKRAGGGNRRSRESSRLVTYAARVMRLGVCILVAVLSVSRESSGTSGHLMSSHDHLYSITSVRRNRADGETITGCAQASSSSTSSTVSELRVHIRRTEFNDHS
jgi:hypothetical protein